MSAATIRVSVPSGRLRTFDAEHVAIKDGLVTATGYWRHDRERGRQTVTWPRQQLVQIAWTREVARAA